MGGVGETICTKRCRDRCWRVSAAARKLQKQHKQFGAAAYALRPPIRVRTPYSAGFQGIIKATKWNMQGDKDERKYLHHQR